MFSTTLIAPLRAIDIKASELSSNVLPDSNRARPAESYVPVNNKILLRNMPK